jgi:CelD/BcsL family acetyltransferase involved in cellulose biosynthesis
VSGLATTGLDVTVQPDVLATVLKLRPGADFLSTLGKTQRHELRRKRRRYEDRVGPVVIDTDGHGAFERFAELHRTSPGLKGLFMTGEREELFRALSSQPGWRVDEMFSGDRVVAALFGFSDATTYYLYNSAYDTEFADVSPGIVLLTHTIEGLAADGFTRFDFLKGDEEYKTRLGASYRQLYRIET